MSYKGKYRVKKLEKYKGDPTKVTYRSLWERKFMNYCEENPSIIEWSSEEVVIPYRSPIDKRIHRYFPDFWIKVKKGNGKTECILIEIKPKKQTAPPKKPKKVTKKFISEVYTYSKNEAKWKAAKEYCEDRKWKFEIITEDHLF
tara:strand:+ start:7058 stop:7489 length:432 start_codon:yes stop_codon:yes gene_type:complete